MVVDIYLRKCWRGPPGEEDFTDEIEEKMSELELLEREQENGEELDEEGRHRRAVEKTNIALDIAMWYLGIQTPFFPSPFYH